jgi:drug/metabolite transporter (DMT)-like permease
MAHGPAGRPAAIDRRRTLGLLLAATAAVGYGCGPILAKDVYRSGVAWDALLVWRFIIAASITWVLVAVRPSSRAALAGIDRRRALALTAIGAVFTLNAATYYAALGTVPASLVALLLFTFPAFVAVLATRFGHVAPGPRPWIALAITLAGAVLLVGGVEAGGNPFGIFLAFLSPLAYSVYTILSARIAGERRGTTAVDRSGRAGPDTESAIAAALLLSGAGLSMIAAAFVAGARALPSEIPASAWPGIVGVAVASTVLAMQATYAGVARIGAARAAMVGVLDPVTVVVLATLLLGDRYQPLQFAGGAVVIVGVLLAQSADPPVVDRSGSTSAGAVRLGGREAVEVEAIRAVRPAGPSAVVRSGQE